MELLRETESEADAAASMRLVDALKAGACDDDDGGVIFDVYATGLRDVVPNLNADDLGLTVTEHDDTVRPTILSADLSYDTFLLKVTASETVDARVASRIDPSQFYLADTSGGNDVQLTGATVTTQDLAT